MKPRSEYRLCYRTCPNCTHPAFFIHTREIEVSLKRPHPDSADESAADEPVDRESAGTESGRADGLGPLVNHDRLEKKKNREKRRRSEVNERFEEV